VTPSVTYAAKHYQAKYTRIEVRFRGRYCFIDAYTEPGSPPAHIPEGQRDEWIESLRTTPTHLCRLAYLGSADRWGFAFYTYSNERYEPSFLPSGSPQGTPEEAFAVSAIYLD